MAHGTPVLADAAAALDDGARSPRRPHRQHFPRDGTESPVAGRGVPADRSVRGADLRDPSGSIGRLRDVAVRGDDRRLAGGGATRAQRVSGDIDVPWSAVRVHQPDCLDLHLGITADPPADAIWLVGGGSRRHRADRRGGEARRPRRRRRPSIDGPAGSPRSASRSAPPRYSGASASAAPGRPPQSEPDPRLRHPSAGAPHTPLTLETTRARLASLEAHELAGLLDRLPHPVAGAMLETLEPAHAARTRHHLARRHATRRARRRLTNFHAP